jgi:ribulose-phosphate 3-epimerase
MKIWPSLLAANLLHLEADILQLEKHGVHQIHLDIMDNHYVPNLSFGPAFCKAIKQRFPSIEIDVHLMIEPVDPMISIFANAGAKRITIHPHATRHLNFSLNLIRENHCLAGIALNPADDLQCVQFSRHQLDYVLMMTVNPGFGGQKLLPEVVEKISLLKSQYTTLPIMVDGGVTLENISILKKAGVEDFVIGSSLFQATNFPQSISDFLNLVDTHVK